MSSDKRRHVRKDTVTPIKYIIKGVQTDEIFEGVIANVSESGFCLLSTSPLRKGEKIEIKYDQHVHPRKASVRWSNQYHLYYKIGLEFV